MGMELFVYSFLSIVYPSNIFNCLYLHYHVQINSINQINIFIVWFQTSTSTTGKEANPFPNENGT